MKPILDSRQLLAFAILGRTRSFTQTAREIFLTQSAVSHTIKALEADLDCRLFDRVNKKVTLTHAGEQLYHHVGKILGEMEAARKGLEQLKRWGQSRLRLAAPATICSHLLPGVLREFKGRYPQCVISIESCDSQESVRLVEENRADMAIGIEAKADERFDFSPLFSDELVFIVSPQHPWAATGRMVREELPSQAVILYGRTSYTGRLIDGYFRREHLTLNSVLEFRSMSAIRELVKLNLGIGIVAPWVVRKDLAEGTVMSVPLGRRKLKRTWGVVTRRERRLSLPESTLVQQIRRAAAEGFGVVPAMAGESGEEGRDPSAGGA